MSFRMGGAAALVMMATLASAGCTIQTSPPPVGTAEVRSADVDREIYSSPSARYEGRTVYFYNGRWMFREDGRWKYYVEEPPELYKHRTREQHRRLPPRDAPPAPRSDRPAAPTP